MIRVILYGAATLLAIGCSYLVYKLVRKKKPRQAVDKMRTFGQHKDSILHSMNTANSVVKLQELINATNTSANSIAGMFPIGRLMDKVTINPGDRLPPNMAGIVIVRDTSDNSRVWQRGEAAVYSDEEVNRFYLDMDHSPYSETALPFKSTGSIAENSSILTCPNLIATISGSFQYEFKCGDTVYQSAIDADGKAKLDADGKIVLNPVPSTDFDPQLPGVRFYDSGVEVNEYPVYYGENEMLAYWFHSIRGWIMSDIEFVDTTPAGYFDITDGEGIGIGEWEHLYITFEENDEYDAEIEGDDFAGTVVCITNDTNGDYYYKVTSLNDDNTFNLNRSHPYDETDVVVRVFTESATRIRFVDYSEADVTSGTYDVFYWTYPNPLSKDEDVIPFAYPDYLELMTLRRLPETKDRRPVSKTEIDGARMLAKKKENIQAPPVRPLTAQGSPFSIGPSETGAYTARGG